MLLNQFLRLVGNTHAIGKASVSLLFDSLGLHKLRELIKTEFENQFSHFQNVHAFQVQLRGD